MSLSNLPPGVTESMIPGNRPEDVAWDLAAESIKASDILEVCEQHRVYCDNSTYRDCSACDGSGIDVVHECDCSTCGGIGILFNGCTVHLINADNVVDEHRDLSDCKCWEGLVTRRMNNGKDDV